jgi:glycosyltransferase involved in cell wall biosynthesis
LVICSMQPVHISVAMATFNGERFLREQLDSLSQQELLPYELVVGDDGSTDNTLEVIEDFAARAPFPVHIASNPKNLGFGDNFLTAARRCAGDWIAFCDQDDVWLPNKLSDCAAAIEAHPGLCQVLQRAELCDVELNCLGRSFPPFGRAGVHEANSQFGFWVWLGFLQTVRSDTIHDIEHSVRPLGIESHDKWTCMIANAIGGICVLDAPAALYRRHQGALSGSHSITSKKQALHEARRTGESHYTFLAEVAADSAAHLDQLADATRRRDWAARFERSAELFKRLSNAQHSRAALYAASTLFDRIRIYAALHLQSGYFGPPFLALGWQSAAKDAVRVLLGKRFSVEEVQLD